MKYNFNLNILHFFLFCYYEINQITVKYFICIDYCQLNFILIKIIDLILIKDLFLMD
jgi:hypothetical protein